nr:RNA-directed DNA polymerase, eukaryota [Tanacetum cinerariifolium]
MVIVIGSSCLIFPIINLNTIWVGRFHLRVNAVRYERPSKPQVSVRKSVPTITFKPNLYVNAVKKVNDFQSTPIHSTQSFSNPALVIDDSCLIERDLKCHAMGKVKDVNSIPNLPSILAKEGFEKVNLSYLGGLWVMLELHTEEIKDKIIRHMGVNSWFNVLQPAIDDFISEERIVWVDIEGIPMHVWSRNTFLKIGTRWGEALDIEESYDTTFARKRLCIKTNLSYNILECLKLFLEARPIWCELRSFSLGLLNLGSLKRTSKGPSVEEEVSLPYPPGFTPGVSHQDNNIDATPVQQSHSEFVAEADNYPIVSSKVMNFSHISDINESSCGASALDFKEKMVNGGSILDILDNMIRVGQSMGYDMEGCSKDIERIIGLISRWNGDSIVFGDFNELDRFLVSERIISKYAAVTAICLDRHLSDHRPILLKEVDVDFGPTPFRIYHSWFNREGFDDMVKSAWNSFTHSDPNPLIRFKKKLQALKAIIRDWIKEQNKSKVKWAIEGDENSNFFHGIINKKRSQLSIRGVFVDGDWVTNPK